MMALLRPAYWGRRGELRPTGPLGGRLCVLDVRYAGAGCVRW